MAKIIAPVVTIFNEEEKPDYAGCCFANKLRKISIQSAKKKRRLKGF